MRAEEIATAMEVRGFTTPNRHKVEWHDLHLSWGDWLALLGVIIFWWGRVTFGHLNR